jgi:hypothetical protein
MVDGVPGGDKNFKFAGAVPPRQRLDIVALLSRRPLAGRWRWRCYVAVGGRALVWLRLQTFLSASLRMYDVCGGWRGCPERAFLCLCLQCLQASKPFACAGCQLLALLARARWRAVHNCNCLCLLCPFVSCRFRLQVAGLCRDHFLVSCVDVDRSLSTELSRLRPSADVRDERRASTKRACKKCAYFACAKCVCRVANNLPNK